MDIARCEMRAQVLKAMAHPARLVMVEALAEGEKCVCELQKLVGLAMPTVSRHLSQMKNAGIVAAAEGSADLLHRVKEESTMWNGVLTKAHIKLE